MPVLGGFTGFLGPEPSPPTSGSSGRFNTRDVGVGDTPYERFLSSSLQSSGNLDEIIQSGIFSEDEINNILRGSSRERALQRRSGRDRLRRSYQSRLGPRAGGAAELTFANRVLAPQFAEQLAQKRRLREQSKASRFQAILAKAGIEQSRADAFLRREEGQREDDTGFLDFLPGLGAIAEGGAAIFSGGATLPASAARRFE